MRYPPWLKNDAKTIHATDVPAADTAAVVNVNADVTQCWSVKKISGSYRGGTPTGAGVTVAIGGVTVWQISLPLANNTTFDFDFPDGLYNVVLPAGNAPLNEALVVTATDPGAATSCAAILNVSYQ
jgi:hypothetical protein